MSINTFESDFEGNQNFEHDDSNYRNQPQGYSPRHYYSQSAVIFQICQSCFWCASSFIRLRVFDKCPLCYREDTIDSMPIASGEIYSYDYNDKT